MTISDLMLLPFIECLILVGIHAYLGIHVIRRRVIFVDLALAQIAALGATVGIIFGIEPDTAAAFVYSLTFCIIGAAVFAFSRMRDDRVPQEAVIGLTYAITFALGILVVQKLEGVEAMEDILVGGLLWVRWSDIAITAVAYGIIAVIHLAFRKQFLLISENPEAAYRQGMRVRLWDFLFYATFGIVITISVSVAGVLLVFVFLVAPAILAVMISHNLKTQLAVGWISGTVVTTLGLYLSYVLDLPCGPSVVAFYGLTLLGAAAVVAVVRAPSRGRALAWAGAGTVLIVVVGFGLVLEGKVLAGSTMELGLGHHEGHHHHHHGDEADHDAHHAHDDHAPAATTPAASAAVDETDYDARLEAIRAGLAGRPGRAARQLHALLADPELPLFFRSEAADLLVEAAGENFGYDAEADVGANQTALEKIAAWAARRGPHGGHGLGGQGQGLGPGQGRGRRGLGGQGQGLGPGQGRGRRGLGGQGQGLGPGQGRGRHGLGGQGQGLGPGQGRGDGRAHPSD